MAMPESHPYTEEEIERYYRDVVDDKRGIDGILDCAVSGISGALASAGSTGICWKAVEYTGKALGYSNNYDVVNTMHFVPVGSMLILLGATLYDAHFQKGENTVKILKRIREYL